MRHYEESELQQIKPSEYKVSVKFWDGNGGQTKTLSISYETFKRLEAVIIADTKGKA